MSNILLIRQFLLFFAYWLVQVILARHLSLFSVAFCFLYVGYLLQMPLQTDRSLLLLIAFLMGLMVDMVYDTMGLHAFCMVLIAFLRPVVVAFLASGEDMYEISVREMGLGWYLRYMVVLVSIHHFALFFLEQFNTHFWLNSLSKVFLSTIFTIFTILLVQYLFYAPILGNARK